MVLLSNQIVYQSLFQVNKNVVIIFLMLKGNKATVLFWYTFYTNM